MSKTNIQPTKADRPIKHRPCERDPLPGAKTRTPHDATGNIASGSMTSDAQNFPSRKSAVK